MYGVTLLEVVKLLSPKILNMLKFLPHRFINKRGILHISPKPGDNNCGNYSICLSDLIELSRVMNEAWNNVHPVWLCLSVLSA